MQITIRSLNYEGLTLSFSPNSRYIQRDAETILKRVQYMVQHDILCCQEFPPDSKCISCAAENFNFPPQ